jgi:hypothetical protein
VTYTTPYKEPKPEEGITEKDISEMIEKALKTEREEQVKEQYEAILTAIDEWGVKPPAPTFIPLGALAPEWAKFPERVLVVAKITEEEEEVTGWQDRYTDDVVTISETANVSPPIAKNIISRLKAKGYKILKKDTIEKTDEVKLLWFDDGWDDTLPKELNWCVEVVGQPEIDIIKGYSHGVIEISPVADDERLYVKAGYIDLKDEFKPKSEEVIALETEKEGWEKEKTRLEKRIVDLKEEINKDKEKPFHKRDISKATRRDLIFGTVKLEEFLFVSSSSGVFLGNYPVDNELWSQRSRWDSTLEMQLPKQGLILTNAHVADNGLGDMVIMISADREVMWVVFPGKPYIRYTQDSDFQGTPAHVLSIDGQHVISRDYDAAILTTTSVYGMDRNAAKLGNSNNVSDGDPVITVGNPIGLQKFLSLGVISNKDYDSYKAVTLGDRERDRKALHSTMWYECTIGIGGTSGSGLWALAGSEAGKVVALHNIGLYSGMAVVSTSTGLTGVEIDPDDPRVKSLYMDTVLKEFLERVKDDFFQVDINSGLLNVNVKGLLRENKDLDVYFEGLYAMSRVDGMNAAVPINGIKIFLQERGIDPTHFGWDPIDPNYWTK